MNIILGAGLSGLITACKFDGQIYEAGLNIKPHRALLRFRSDTISRITGIPFKKVKVTKSIYYEQQHVQPDVRLSNMYAQKVLGKVMPRSIINIDPTERYVAPYDFHEQLYNRHANRINHGMIFTHADHHNAFFQKMGEKVLVARQGHPIISTVPINIMAANQLGIDLDLHYKGIHVYNFQLVDIEAYQTIYYPDEDYSLYRASITGDKLIVEFMSEPPNIDEALEFVAESFGFYTTNIMDTLNKSEQRFGKIEPNEDKTRPVIYELSANHRIFSLGRFAVWRNILLDDLDNDMHRVSKLINITDPYAFRKEI